MLEHRIRLQRGRERALMVFRDLLQPKDIPPLRLALVVQVVGEEGPEVGGEVGGAAFYLGAGGAEIAEPVAEQRPRHGLQRGVHLPVQLDLVIQRPEGGGNGALFGERRDGQLETRDIPAAQAAKDSAHIDELLNLNPPFRASNEPAEKRRIDSTAVGAKQHEVLTQSKLGAGIVNRRYPRICPPGKDHVVLLILGLSGPSDEIGMRDAPRCREVNSPSIHLWDAHIWPAGLDRFRRLVVAV